MQSGRDLPFSSTRQIFEALRCLPPLSLGPTPCDKERHTRLPSESHLPSGQMKSSSLWANAPALIFCLALKGRGLFHIDPMMNRSPPRPVRIPMAQLVRDIRIEPAIKSTADVQECNEFVVGLARLDPEEHRRKVIMEQCFQL